MAGLFNSPQERPRLLLLMSTNTYKATAFLEAAARLGVQVTVGTNKPQILAFANPEGNLTLNFRAPEKATQKIIAFAQRYPLKAIVAADDEGVVLAAMAAKALGLPHNPLKAIFTTRNKLFFREKLANSELLSPEFAAFSINQDAKPLASLIGFPCVLKPLFLSASRGVIRVNNESQFFAAFNRIKHLLQQPAIAAEGKKLAQKILLESYIPGCEIALEGLLSKGKLKVLAIFDKPDPLEGPFFEETIYVTPSRLSNAQQKRIIDCVSKALAILGLVEGPVHAELRLNDSGPWLLEIAARSIGGLCSRTLRFGEQGISLEEVILRNALGMSIAEIEREPLAAGVMMIPIPRPGKLLQVHGLQAARQVSGIEDIKITLPPGHYMIPLPEGNRYLGFIFARAESHDQVERALRKAYGLLNLQIDSGED